MSFLYGILTSVLLFAAAVAFIATMSAAPKYVIRDIFWKIRSRFIGGTDLVWYQIIPDDTRKTTTEDVRSSSFVAAFMDSIAPANWIGKYRRGLASFVWTRDENHSVRLCVGIDSAHANVASIRALANSLNASYEEMDNPPDIPTDAICVSEIKGTSISNADGRFENAGDVVTAFSEQFVDQSSVGSIVLTVEPTFASEKKRLQAFISDRQSEIAGSSGSFTKVGNNALIISEKAIRTSIVATSTDDSIAKSIQSNTVGRISSLGFSVKSFNPSDFRAASTLAIVAEAIITAGAALSAFLLTHSSVLRTLALIALGCLFVAFVATYYLSKSRTAAIFRTTLAKGYVELPAYTFWSARWLFMARLFAANPLYKDRDGRIAANPSDNQIIYMSPNSVHEFIAFPSSTNAVSVDVARKKYPARGIAESLLNQKFPGYIGQTGLDQPLCYDSGKYYQFPLVAFGAMGSGKTNLLNVIFINSIQCNMDRNNDYHISSIWCETKGAGARKVWNQIKHIEGSVYIDVYHPKAKYRLALEGPRVGERGTKAKKVAENVQILVNGMISAWSSSGIGPQSKPLLIEAMTIAMMLNEDDLEFLQIHHLLENPAKPNIIQIAYWILRGSPNKADIGGRLVQLNRELEARVENGEDLTERERILQDNLSKLERFYDPKTNKQFDHLMSPPRNKLEELLSTTALWEPVKKRRDLYVSQLPDTFRPVVINLGPPGLSDFEEGAAADDDTMFSLSDSRRMLAVFNYILWENVKQRCNGWEQYTNNRCVVFYDEVADVASYSTQGDIPDALAESLKEGRAFGFSVQLGSQHPDQFPRHVLAYVKAIVSKAWFSLSSSDAINLAVSDLSAGDNSNVTFSHRNITALPVGVCASTISVNGHSIASPYTLIVPEANQWAGILLDPSEPTVEDAILQLMVEQRGSIDGARKVSDRSARSVSATRKKELTR